METLIKLHEQASALAWNIGRCRKYQRFAFESITVAKKASSQVAEKDARESLNLYSKCEQRFLSRYQKVLTQINNLIV